MNDLTTDQLRSLRSMARDALNVQDACNLSGVVHSFSRVMTELRGILQSSYGTAFSTEDLNRHPIAVLYASKIACLTGCDISLSLAQEWCEANS